MADKGRPLPKFGEWDVNDPASAEGFTVIFNKARNEKRTGGKPDSPPKEASAYKHKATLGKPQSKKWFCCSTKNQDFSILNKSFPGKIGWVHRKEWDAYPVLPPTTTYPAVKPAPGLYYVNAFEPFISTMETETIASLNVVDLLLQEHYGRGVCGQKKGEQYEPSTPVTEDFVWGWDC